MKVQPVAMNALTETIPNVSSKGSEKWATTNASLTQALLELYSTKLSFPSLKSQDQIGIRSQVLITNHALMW